MNKHRNMYLVTTKTIDGKEVNRTEVKTSDRNAVNVAVQNFIKNEFDKEIPEFVINEAIELRTREFVLSGNSFYQWTVTINEIVGYDFDDYPEFEKTEVNFHFEDRYE